MPHKLQPQPPIKLLKKLLTYDPISGNFYWNSNKTGGIKKGDIAGHLRKDGYIRITIKTPIREKPILYSAHKLAWYYMTGDWIQVDHKNRKRNDNKLKNLRPASQSENIVAAPRGRGKYLRGVGYKPVSKNGTQKELKNPFQAKITVNGKRIYLGHFKTEKEAHEAYCKAAKKYHGEFHCKV